MALIEKITAIADAIREKNGSADKYTLPQMVTAIQNIKTGITPSGTKSIDSNGVFDVTSYASAEVNVDTLSNFHIVSGTQKPVNPKGNTLWIMGNVDVTKFAFSNTEPANPVEGMLWLKTDEVASTDINALRENFLKITAPTEVFRMYKGGEFVRIQALFYTAGKWVNKIYAFNDAYGESLGRCAPGMRFIIPDDQNVIDDVIQPKNHDLNIDYYDYILRFKWKTAGLISYLHARLETPIDLTNVKKIGAFANALSNDYYDEMKTRLEIFNKSDELIRQSAELFNSKTFRDISIDTSDLTGEHYIEIWGRLDSGYIYYAEIYLEYA